MKVNSNVVLTHTHCSISFDRSLTQVNFRSIDKLLYIKAHQ